MPELALYGTGGTYFLKDCYKWNLLVFKPEDEEPFAEHNPRIGRICQNHCQVISKESQARAVFAKEFDRVKAGSVKSLLTLWIMDIFSLYPAQYRFDYFR